MSGRCEWCGEAFEMTTPKRRFCSEEHRARAERVRRMREVECVCRQCGEHFTTSRAEVRRGRGQFCTKHCAVVWGNAHREKTPQSTAIKYAECIECGDVFVKRHGAKLCGDECRRLWTNRYMRENVNNRKNPGRVGWQHPGVYCCERCGESFVVEQERAVPKRYCSPECNNRASIHRRRIRIRDASGRHSGKEWHDLLDRWGRRCAYCGCKLEFDGDCTNPRLATRDHIVPLVDGGSDCIDNIVPACLRCNGAKNRKPLGEYAVEVKDQLAMAAILVAAPRKRGNTVHYSSRGPAHAQGPRREISQPRAAGSE